MQFFWTKVRKNIHELLNDNAYDENAVNKALLYTDNDQEEIDRNMYEQFLNRFLFKIVMV